MGISNRGTKAKTITSCDNAFVTNLVLARDPGAQAKRLIGRPQEALLCAKAKRQQQLVSVAKAKRQLQSAQSERKSTTRYGNDSNGGKFVYFLTSYRVF
ncbi:hypothetical protein [Lysinibacillus sp. NPDC096212]|uniref:hypothetical protein n=1 Tax=Lysinibacillus sp. NPDC096212 TaxID=3364135 RepID=UPI00382E40FF